MCALNTAQHSSDKRYNLRLVLGIAVWLDTTGDANSKKKRKSEKDIPAHTHRVRFVHRAGWFASDAAQAVAMDARHKPHAIRASAAHLYMYFSFYIFCTFRINSTNEIFLVFCIARSFRVAGNRWLAAWSEWMQSDSIRRGWLFSFSEIEFQHFPDNNSNNRDRVTCFTV